MGEVISLEDARSRHLLRSRPLRPPSPYALAEMRYTSSANLMARFCADFIELRGRCGGYPTRLALGAIEGFLAQAPRFTQAWVQNGQDSRMVPFLVRASSHAEELKRLFKAVSDSGPLNEEQIAAIHSQLDTLAAYVEGVLETTLTAFPARL